MFYIHQSSCISPQETFPGNHPEELHEQSDNKLHVIEPVYTGVSPGMLRRLGKAGRIGMGTAMQLMQHALKPDGIVIGTANGGMEESIRFLKQIIEYNEDMLAPGSFVQSTANALASQLGIFTKNNGYNITHVHKGHAFENAVIDVVMLLQENPTYSYLLGGVDEIASYNYNIEYAAGWYKTGDYISSKNLYQTHSPGSIAGEGAAMFLVSNEKEDASAILRAVKTFHSGDTDFMVGQLEIFIDENIPAGETVDLFLSGDNGDSRYEDLFTSCEAVLPGQAAVARFKHMCGEYPTASAFALWLACVLPLDGSLPAHMIKKQGKITPVKNVLVYNFHHGVQHSLMLVSKLK